MLPAQKWTSFQLIWSECLSLKTASGSNTRISVLCLMKFLSNTPGSCWCPESLMVTQFPYTSESVMKQKSKGKKGRNRWSQGPEEESLFAFLLGDGYYSVFWIHVFSFLKFYPSGWNCERLTSRSNCLLSCAHNFSRDPWLKPPDTLIGYRLPFKYSLEELDSM